MSFAPGACKRCGCFGADSRHPEAQYSMSTKLFSEEVAYTSFADKQEKMETRAEIHQLTAPYRHHLGARVLSAIIPISRAVDKWMSVAFVVGLRSVLTRISRSIVILWCHVTPTYHHLWILLYDFHSLTDFLWLLFCMRHFLYVYK